MTMRILICLLTAALSPLLTASETALKPMDLFDMQWATQPQISPDGKHVVYVRNRYDVMTDRVARTLWLVDSEGDDHQPLTDTTVQANTAVWSTDGKRLAYVSNAAGRNQIHVRWMESGRDTAITQLQASPSALSWSPDGQYLAFVQFVANKRPPIATLPARPEGAEWNDPPKVFEDLVYRYDGRGYHRGGYNQIFIVAASGGKPVQLTSENYNHGGSLSWSSDAGALYFSANYEGNWQRDLFETDIYRVNVTTRDVTRITERDGPDTDPAVSPDGKWLAYRGSNDIGGYQDSKLYLLNLADNQAPEQILELDRPVTGLQWATDSRGIYFSYVDQGSTRVARTNLQGRQTAVADNLGGASIGRPYASGSFSVAANGSVAHELNLSHRPAEVALTRSGKTKQLTDLNRDWEQTIDLIPPEEIWYTSSHDEMKIQGWIIKPPGFEADKKYPLILEIHGGPHTAYGNVFSAEAQLYAAAGYVVLYTNPRGSTSYGEDFAREIYQDYPGNDYFDLMSGVDALIEQGYIDEQNLFVTGGSGGGILTAWIVTQTDRFAAAVSQKPVINWYTMTLVSDIGSEFWRSWFDALPWEDPAAYLEKSPVNYVERITTPTMLITGEEDWRTPMSESEQFYLALKMNEVPTALVRIPNASHSIAARPSGLLAKVAYVLGWFERYREGKNQPED